MKPEDETKIIKTKDAQMLRAIDALKGVKNVVSNLTVDAAKTPANDTKTAAKADAKEAKASAKAAKAGQADTTERKVEICGRAYDLLVANGFPPEDIIFDPNIFAIATGIDEHRRYAIDFIEACREIRAEMPETRVEGFLAAGHAATATFLAGGWLALATVLGPFTPPLPRVLGIGTVVLAVPWWAHRRRRAKVRVERKLEAWPDIARSEPRSWPWPSRCRSWPRQGKQQQRSR